MSVYEYAVEFILALIVLFELIIRLIPTKFDNSLFKTILSLFNDILGWIIPSVKKGGGFHNRFTFWNIFSGRKRL